MDTASATTGQKALAICVVVAITAALAYAAYRDSRPADGPGPVAAVSTGTTPETTAAPGPEATETAAVDAGVPPAPAPEAPAPAAPPPSFDVVRVSPDGSALVAGRAAPGSMVTVMTEQGPLAEVEADAEGNFVAIFRAEPGGAPQALTLEAEGADGWSAASSDVVMLLPEAPADAADAATAAEPETEVAAAAPGSAEPEVAAAAAGTAEPEVEVASAEPDAAPAGDAPRIVATAILRGDSVEATPTVRDGTPRDVTLASIGYAEQGQVALAGFGTAGSVLRVYVDGQLADEAAVGDDGRWALALGEVEQGVYRLRIDQLGADGRVASRVETPFQRDFPPVPRPGTALEGMVTVQPGNNLWTLARLHYGRGVLYTQIYTANSALIRDPDLIYPGQILTMPELAAE